MVKRKIIKIDEKKCNGCGECIPNCPEGALQIIDGKARLISDLFCDGLGACIGHCPQGAITIEEREAEKYDERKVMKNIVRQGKNVIKAHLSHLKEHNQFQYLKQAVGYLKELNIDVPKEDITAGHGAFPGECPSLPKASASEGVCPGSKVVDFGKKQASIKKTESISKQESQLGSWPVQIMLVPSFAAYLQNADLLIAADCVPFAYANFHEDLLKAKTLLVGCPKLDDISIYKEKFIQIFKNNFIKSVTYVHMEVPCCFGLIAIIKDAIKDSGKEIPFDKITISIHGEVLK